MKSMFQMSPFGGPSFGSHSPALGMVRLAQTPAPAPGAPTTTTEPAQDVSGLTGGIQDLLKQLPPDVLGRYSEKYKACQTQLATGGAVGLVAGGKCLSDLYKEIESFIKNGPPKAAVPVPAAGSDLILPVVVGVLGIGALIWGISKL